MLSKEVERSICEHRIENIVKTDILLIRHGNIDMAQRVPGRLPDVHLSPEGVEQMKKLSESLADVKIDAIYASPLDRTVESANIIAQNRSIEIQKCDPLVEINFGNWTGKKFADLESDPEWKQFHSYRNGTIIPDGELMVEVEARMVKLIEELFRKHQGKTLVLVSHNDPIKSVIAHYLGISLDMFHRITITTASISILSMYHDLVEIRGINLKKFSKTRF